MPDEIHQSDNAAGINESGIPPDQQHIGDAIPEQLISLVEEIRR